MTNKNMKGLFKGLRYIGQIFDEESKNDEIHIGLPTDVKHVAHIGFDGKSDAAADSNPSWMRGFNPNPGFQHEPLDSNAENPDRASEDSKKVKRGKDQSGAPKSSRRRNLSDTSNNNSNETSTKPRHRRHNSKDLSECSSVNSEGEKKMRRKKHSTKDSEGGSSKSRSKHGASSDVSDSGAEG